MKHPRVEPTLQPSLGQRIVEAARLAVTLHLQAQHADRPAANMIVGRATALNDRWNRFSADHG